LFWERHTSVKWWQKTVKRVIALSTKWTGMNYISFMFQFNCILQTAPFFAPRSSNCLTGSNSCCWSQRTIVLYTVTLSPNELDWNTIFSNLMVVR
jgi:hypothetical protein